LRPLRVLKREAKSPFIFVSEGGCTGLAKLIERAGIAAKIGFKVHPNMLRHAAAIELHRRRLASPARCGRLPDQTNMASAAYRPPRWTGGGGLTQKQTRLLRKSR
jgi:hypothetical protein